MGKANTFVSQWMRHRSVLFQLLELVPDEHTNFQPWEGALSLSDLAIHIGGSGFMFTSAVQSGIVTRPQTAPKAQSMEETLRIVREYTDKTKAVMESLTDDQIEGMVDASQLMGFSAPGKVLLHSMREHEIHHKGQLYVYARLVGVQKVPFFINTKA
jgi:uncharacterized damage-inducible protein DinB